MKPQWTVIANPKTSRNNLSQVKQLVDSALSKWEVTANWQFTEAPQHAMSLAAGCIEAGARQILAIGGDGTLHEVVNGIMQQKSCPSQEVLVGLIPNGTGNDWARMHQIPTQATAAIKLLQTGRTHYQDLGKVSFSTVENPSVRYFNNVMGVGLEAQIVEDALDINKKGVLGQFSYFKTLLRTLGQYQPIEFLFEGESFQYAGPLLVGTIGLCRYNGAGMQLVPQAIPDDGLFDLTLIEPLSFRQVLFNLLKLYNGRIYRHPRAHPFRAERLRVSSQTPFKVEADGELIGGSDFQLEILPKALRFLAP